MTHEKQSHWRRLAIFTKSLDDDHIKTRLAKEIGTADARLCYETLLDATIKAAAGFDTTVYVAGRVTDQNPKWLRGLPHRTQAEGDLGERMLACIKDGADVILGCDCPTISRDYIESAFASLEDADVVLGPVEDGGYVLIGMHDTHPELFEDIAWSTSTVLAQTLERAHGLHLRVHLLSQTWDIDTVDDYRRWQAHIKKGTIFRS